MMLLSAFLVLSALAGVSVGQPSCQMAVGDHALCACTMSDGSGTIDISSYAKKDSSYKFKATQGDYDYYYNPCFPLSVEGANACSDDTAAGCQTTANAVTTSFKIGTFDQVSYSVDPSTNNVVISYQGGDDSRHMAVALKCNPLQKEPKFTALGEQTQPLEYEFTLESVCSCAFKSGHSCTDSGGGGDNNKTERKSKNNPGVVGIVLICLAFAGFVSYFAIGAVVLRMKYEKTGSDLIIHKSFWKEFPFYVKDGVVFTFSPCYRMIKGERGGYSNFK